MKATQLIYPTPLQSPIATQGDKNDIPLYNNNPLSNLASVEYGFPSITSLNVTEGGLPPMREDFNGLFYLTSDFKYYTMSGGFVTFNQSVCEAIGGYPQGAILQKYISETNAFQFYRSEIDDNTYDFNNNPDNPEYWSNVGINSSIPIATNNQLGAVKIGSGIDVNPDGTISVTFPTVNTATSSVLGISRPDNSTITISNGILSAVRTAQSTAPLYIKLTTARSIVFNNNLGIQWGTGALQSGDVNFQHAMANTNYTILLGTSAGPNFSGNQSGGWYNKNLSYFTVTGGNVNGFTWAVIGTVNI